MTSLHGFIERKLRLRITLDKSAVARPWQRKFLGFRFTNHQRPKRRVAPQAIERFKERVRGLTPRTRGISLDQMVAELSRYLRGWNSYFGYCETPSVLHRLDRWIRRRLRCVIWKQWKRSRTRYRELKRRGATSTDAFLVAYSNHGPWRLTLTEAVCGALPNAYFDSLALPRLRARGFA